MYLSSGVEIPDGLLAANALLNEKPHQGLPTWNPAPHQGISEANCAAAIGLRASQSLNRVQSRYTGKERDAESGLDYFGARYYSSSMGRWMSPDWSDKPTPVPFADLHNPQSLNLYGYVGNNPLSRFDANGHVWDWLKKLGNIFTDAECFCSGKEAATRADANRRQRAADAIAYQIARQKWESDPKNQLFVSWIYIFSGNPEGLAGEAGGAAASEGAATVEMGTAEAGTVEAGAAVNTAGYGNIGGGATTVENALAKGHEYVGPGAKEIAPGVYRSADGTRQFRMTTSDITGAHGDIGPHVHFESIAPDGRTITENSHVGLTNH